MIAIFRIGGTCSVTGRDLARSVPGQADSSAFVRTKRTHCRDNIWPSLVLWLQKDDAILGIAIGVLSAKSFHKNRSEKFRSLQQTLVSRLQADRALLDRRQLGQRLRQLGQRAVDCRNSGLYWYQPTARRKTCSLGLLNNIGSAPRDQLSAQVK
jgi:hypothetical protein